MATKITLRTRVYDPECTLLLVEEAQTMLLDKNLYTTIVVVVVILIILINLFHQTILPVNL